jgi:hypothetical protein
MHAKAPTVILLLALLLAHPLAHADNTTSPQTVDFTVAPLSALPVATEAIVKGGQLNSEASAKSLLTQLASVIHSSNNDCDITRSTFIVNIVMFANKDTTLPGFTIGPVQSSNWYVFDAAHDNFAQATGSAVRIYGDKKPFLIVIHLNSDMSQFAPGVNQWTLNYQYTVTHRQPANVQNLMLAISAFRSLVPATKTAPTAGPGPADFWTWSVLNINTPAGIAISGQIQGPAKATAQLDKTPVLFDDEGFYHWDISIGVPITSYKQLEQVAPTNGAPQVPAEIDKRNILLIGNWYIAPVDLQGAKLTRYPYLVGGISFASKPLHNAMVGVGYGFNTTALYVGTMIVTSNIAPGQKKTNYKIAFGINFPIRTIMGKLGLNTEITALQ